jgi:hypothetical protein
MNSLVELNAVVPMLAAMSPLTSQPDHGTRNGLAMTITLVILLIVLALLLGDVPHDRDAAGDQAVRRRVQGRHDGLRLQFFPNDWRFS